MWGKWLHLCSRRQMKSPLWKGKEHWQGRDNLVGRMPAPEPALTLGWSPMVGWRAEFTNNAPIILIVGLIVSCMETCIHIYVYIDISTFSVCFWCVCVHIHIYIYMCVLVCVCINQMFFLLCKQLLCQGLTWADTSWSAFWPQRPGEAKQTGALC